MGPTYLVMLRTAGAAVIVYEGKIESEAQDAFAALLTEQRGSGTGTGKASVTLATIRTDAPL